ncbi:MAG TPA: MarR family transcriptional regulator, partial [Streptosporangiaceae bacterium]|nr:MarR family transcriptional regulator [Streptosporangiaceae bacterium]
MPDDPGQAIEAKDPWFDYIERFAAVLVAAGFPAMPARVFVALLVAESGRLSAAELAGRLRVSPAAVSGAVRYLIQVGLVHKERVPGSRRDYYRMPGTMWDDLLR